MAVDTRKPITIQELRRRGVPVVPGNEYIPKSMLPKRVSSLKTIRKILSKIKGSLAETVSEMRDEE